MIILIDTTSCTWKCTLRSLKHYKMLCTAVQDNNDSNSRMKLQLVKPQTQDQSNNILKNNSIKCVPEIFQILKCTTVTLPPQCPHQT